MKQATAIQHWLEDRPLRGDIAAIILLLLLWALYFWRVLTPNPINQVSLPQGDYSGQFLAFGTYQAERILDGEIPLWNPYNRAGHPFLADTQSAVFYPIRVLTIFISHFTGGWSYSALQAETIAHYYLASLFMYLLSRTVTHSRLAGIVSAVTFAYGGFLTGYPPRQLAILEAAVWLPLALLGVHKASESLSESRSRLSWLVLSALAIGIGLLAGHPQTSLYSAYVVLAYVVYRALSQNLGLRWAAMALFIAIGLGFSVAAIQLIPGFEYTRLTTRTGYGFDRLDQGFPFADVLGFVLPGLLSEWSPLYNGIAALILFWIAIWQNEKTSRFWGIIALGALVISFGGRAIAYHFAYLFAPGFAWFRDQERAAFVIALCLSLLAGLGTRTLLTRGVPSHILRPALARIVIAVWTLAMVLFVARLTVPREETYAALHAGVLLAIVSTLASLIVSRGAAVPIMPFWRPALILLIVFDLFTVTTNTNWQPIPASQRDLLSDLVPPALDDKGLFRVDGHLGLGENYGTMVSLQDIRGTSPLWLETLDGYYHLPENKLYQVLGVKYVFTDWQQLTIPSTVVAHGQDGTLPLKLHELQNPTSRAWMVYSVMDTPDQGQALGWLADPGFDPLTTVILDVQPALPLPEIGPTTPSVVVSVYKPEHIEIEVTTPTNGVLVVSEMDYPGWLATVDGEKVPILRANAGIRAVTLTAGDHIVAFDYRPVSVRVGAAISVSALAILAGILIYSRRQRPASY